MKEKYCYVEIEYLDKEMGLYPRYILDEDYTQDAEVGDFVVVERVTEVAIGKIISKNVNVENTFEFKENASKWGKNIGGALATAVMLVTNFIIDAPFINWVNKQSTNVVDKISNKRAQKNEQIKPQIQAKGVK